MISTPTTQGNYNVFMHLESLEASLLETENPKHREWLEERIRQEKTLLKFLGHCPDCEV